MGLTRSNFMRTMAFQSTTKFLPGSRWFLGSLEFLTDKFENLSLQEQELSKVTRSGTGHLPLTPVWVGLISVAQLRLDSLGKMDMDLAKVGADHTLAAQTTTSDPINLPSSESDFEYGREVYMVEQGCEMSEKTTNELQREAEEVIARAKRLARELDKRKGHNDLQDDSGGSEAEHPDRAPTRRHHPKFNSRCHSNRDQLWHRSRSILEEFSRVEY
jgi:hypothetical protein